MTAFGTVEDAVRAMKEGAADFLTKPVDTDHLLLLLDRAIEKRRVVTELVLLKEEYQRRFGLPRVLGEDPALKEAMLALQRAAATDATVLLLGESGTGKELMSRALHQLSARAKGPFVAINCAAIPENLLENELFGHEKGAFTGATGRKVGKAELAHKGTLFLDEIGDLPLPLQGKILRLVQEKQFERVGGLPDADRGRAGRGRHEPRPRARSSRRSSSARTSSSASPSCPSRSRRCAGAAATCRSSPRPSSSASPGRWGGKDLRLSEEAKRALAEHSWPGNVRELQNCLERAVDPQRRAGDRARAPAPRPAGARRSRPSATSSTSPARSPTWRRGRRCGPRRRRSPSPCARRTATGRRPPRASGSASRR